VVVPITAQLKIKTSQITINFIFGIWNLILVLLLSLMSRNYKINHQEGIYYITFATVEWVDLFTRTEYRNILIDSLKFCQNHKGLQIYGWVIMSNHVHFILRSKSGDLSGIRSEILRNILP
jgi:hypothetical protein